MIHAPDYILTFGVNRGYSLMQVYQYVPNYLEWLIENVPDFEINPDVFLKLPNPTIPYMPIMGKTITGEMKEVNLGSAIKVSEQIKKTAKDLKEIKYKFGKKTLDILKQKSLGTYICPEWNKLIVATFPINKKD